MKMASAMTFPMSIFFILAGFGLTVIGASVSPNNVWRAVFLSKDRLATRSGLTGDVCSSDSDCLSDRHCLDAEWKECSASSEECRCVPPSGPQSCTSSTDCVPGEGCVSAESIQACGSCEALASVGASFVDDGGSCGSEDVCISVRHLQHLSSSELVFAGHRRASVLCDARGSCATPGHIVVYQSRPMTMHRFCSIVSKGCGRQVMTVNSPRMRYGLRVDSFTEGLKFTPLSAKYETGFEEAVLNVLVRFGM